MDLIKDFSVAELKMWLCNQKPSVRFIERIWYLLEYSKINPDSISSIGIGWMEDGVTFATNSFTLGEFMSIKTNSLNKNFQMYGIEILRGPSYINLIKRLSLKPFKDWKIRTSNLLTSSTTCNELIMLKFTNKIVKIKKNEKTELNKDSFSFLYNDMGIFYKTKIMSPKFKNEFLNQVIKEWNNFGISTPKVCTNVLIYKLIQLYPSLSPFSDVIEELMQIDASCDGITSFDEYLLFCSRFGISYKMRENIPCISYVLPTHSELQPWFNTNLVFNWDTFSRKTDTEETRFQFHPLPEPFCFVIESYYENKPSGWKRTILRYNPDFNKYWVHYRENGKYSQLSASNLKELLFEKLNFQVNDFYLRDSTQYLQCKNASFDEIVKQHKSFEIQSPFSEFLNPGLEFDLLIL